MHRISNQNKNRNGDFKMNKAVIYFGATGNEAADQMVMQVLEEYCAVNDMRWLQSFRRTQDRRE